MDKSKMRGNKHPRKASSSKGTPTTKKKNTGTPTTKRPSRQY